MKPLAILALLVLSFAVPAAAQVSKPKPAARIAAPKAPVYGLKGFRSAQFGQAQAQVIAAIQKDFGVKPTDIQHLNVPTDGTSVLVVNLPQMVPAPGPVTITYIFGKPGLIHVNLVWLITGEATAVQRQEMIQAGVKLTDYFQAYSWDTGKSVLNVPTGPNSVTMFLGRTAKGGAVEVTAAGVSFSHIVNGKSVSSPTPSGPVRLKLGYGSPLEANTGTTLKPGQF